MTIDGWRFDLRLVRELVSLEDTDPLMINKLTGKSVSMSQRRIKTHSIVVFDGTLLGLFTTDIQDIPRAVLFVGTDITLDGRVESNVFKVSRYTNIRGHAPMSFRLVSRSDNCQQHLKQ